MITLAVVNARVQTENPRQPWASGIAVDGEQIVVVASSAEVAKLVAPSTRVIDAKGMIVSAGVAGNSTGRIERGGEATFFVLNDVDVTEAGRSAILIEIRAGKIIGDHRKE